MLGIVLTVAGFYGAVLTMRMFVLIGKGTIMSWDPTRKLITGSLYGHVRNPMILSLLITLTGETILFTSKGIAILAPALTYTGSLCILSE